MKFTRTLHQLLYIGFFGLLLSCSAENDSLEDLDLLNQPAVQQKQSTPNMTLLNVVSVSANGDDGNIPANTLDGDLDTRWSSKGEKGKYITYDLGSSKKISSVKIAWHNGDERKAYFTIRLGDSKSSFKTIVNRKKIGSSGNTIKLETYNFDEISARYVRISCFGNSSNVWNSITETKIYGITENTNPTPPVDNTPFSLLKLQNWKLNGLKGTKSKNEYVHTIPNLKSYINNDWFFKDNDWTILQVWGGSATSSGSRNPRMELRELVPNTDKNIFWDGTTSTEHTMKWKVRIDRLPSSGKLCFGQIHSRAGGFDDIIRVQCKGKANQTSGTVKMRINGYVTEKVDGKGKTVGKFDLGEEMYLELSYKNKIIKLHELDNDGNRIRTIFTSKPIDCKKNYFKVGNYLQSMQGKSYDSSDYGSVAIQKLEVSH